MVNALTPLGLTVDTVNEIITSLTEDLKLIYGMDINVDSNSPDGQMINIFAQSVEDLLQLLVSVYNGFSYQSATGVILDQRVAINGIARKQGTYTITNVTITVNQALTLTGLDALITDPTAQVFTVQDNTGNKFSLQVTNVFGSAGSAALAFQAVDIGAVLTAPNTITNQFTTVLGVTSVNNPTVATSTGVNEETDAQLKVRHDQSFALASTGPADAISAALLAIPDVTDAFVYENYTNGTLNTVVAHTVWCIVTGGTDAEIGQAIYAKKGLGCGMKGSVMYVIARPNGTSFTAQWDVAIAQPLYIQFTINPITAGQQFDTDLLKTELAAALVYKLGQAPNIGDVITKMLVLAPTAYLTVVGVSDNGTDFFDSVQPTATPYYYTVSEDNISINT